MFDSIQPLASMSGGNVAEASIADVLFAVVVAAIYLTAILSIDPARFNQVFSSVGGENEQSPPDIFML